MCWCYGSSRKKVSKYYALAFYGCKASFMHYFIKTGFLSGSRLSRMCNNDVKGRFRRQCFTTEDWNSIDLLTCRSASCVTPQLYGFFDESAFRLFVLFTFRFIFSFVRYSEGKPITENVFFFRKFPPETKAYMRRNVTKANKTKRN